jgi:UDP-N-acetylmuramyl-tripeptide synthetase
MKLSKLLRGIDCRIYGDKTVEIAGLSHNSKTVNGGDLYFALRDNVFVGEAVENGAVAVVTAKKCDGVPCVVVSNVRLAMSLIAKRFYNCADKMKIFGVVGTNGKTTASYMLKHILETGTNKKVGIIGTITNTLTTPDPIDLHKIFFKMRKDGIKTVVMEVSAHAIHYQKIAGINFTGVIFTNISQDHLDFFNSFRAYKDTKISFFHDAKIKFLSVNNDDEYAREICEKAHKNTKIITYSCENGADLTAGDIVLNGNGTDFTLNYPEKMRVHIPICGKFNIYNTLSAVAVAIKCGIKRDRIERALSTFPQVAGRFNTYQLNGGTVIIDYAHTPDGLKKILTAGRELLKGDGAKLISVFGCGGERDRTKRGIMGQISVALADFTVITSDNPRTENPDEIINEIERGIITRDISAVVDNILDLSSAKYIKITDRAEAIEYALSQVRAGDIVVIAGKGHEDYMDINGEKIKYSDAETVKNRIAAHTTDMEK